MTEDDKRKICNKVGLSSTLEQIVFECMEQYANDKLEAERSELRNLLQEIVDGWSIGNKRLSDTMYWKIKDSLKTK